MIRKLILTALLLIFASGDLIAAESLTVVFTSDTKGHLEPCG